jgi:hypothetical protein
MQRHTDVQCQGCGQTIQLEDSILNSTTFDFIPSKTIKKNEQVDINSN